MNIELTKHAQKALAEREIPVEWLEWTLSAPELVLPDPDDATVERRFRRIPQNRLPPANNTYEAIR
jgi:hypothetical protein